MRKPAHAVAAVVTAGLVAALVPVGAAHAARAIPDPLFGQHVAAIATQAPAGLAGSVGAIRLWDAGVAWRDVEIADDVYDWNALDAAVDNAHRLGATEVLYTLGSTPRWAAANPNSRYGLYGPGSNSHPRSDRLYLDYLRAVAERYGPRITAYQVWNEANLRDFYLGTPDQMARLTKRARAVLRSVNPRATLVAASTTVRSKGPVGKWGRKYGAAMRRVGWPVDAVSAHFYPPATKGPGTRVAYIKRIKKYYKRYGAKRKPLWDTEMNYGDTRAYMRTKRTYTGAKAATYVARTYLDSMRYGVSRVFWYGWDIHVLGTDLTARDGSGTVTAGGLAFRTTQAWMAGGRWYGCRTRSRVTTCTIRQRDGSKVRIRYASRTKTYRVPRGTSAIEFLDGSVKQVSSGQRIRLSAQPVLMR
jgi:hypothetical protein